MVISNQISTGYVCDGKHLPSVSSILKTDPKYPIFNRSLAARKGDYPSAAFAKERGHYVHSAARKFIITGEVDLPERYFNYWDQLQRQLAPLDFTDVIWAEGPTTDKLSHLRNGEHCAVWDTKNNFCGCPDLVANVGGVRALCEFKTSTMLYRDNYQKDFSEYSSWFLYHQAAMQVSAYASAFEKITKVPIDVGIIVVATEDDGQLFVIEKPQLKSSFNKFKKLAKAFK